MAVEILARPPRRPDFFWVGLSIAVLLWVGVVSVLIDRARLDSAEAYAALSSQAFSQRMSGGLSVDFHTSRLINEDGVVGRVSFGHSVGHSVNTPRGNGGGVIISYEIYSSPNAASTAFEKHLEGLQTPPSYEEFEIFKLKGISEEHSCTDSDVWGQDCHAHFGVINVQALSRMQLIFKDRRVSMTDLLRTAIAHAKEVTSGR